MKTLLNSFISDQVSNVIFHIYLFVVEDFLIDIDSSQLC